MIFVSIASTYTPICLIALKGFWGWSLLAIIWGLAVIGILIKIFWIHAPRWFSSVIYVVDGGGSLKNVLLGDLITRTALNNGWEGFVIYGSIRDVEPISGMKIGVKALNSIPLKTERKGAGEENVQITFGGVTFKPGDYIYADSSGIIVSSDPLLKPE